ncbi:MAG TPA: M24 family metallopeptidase [Acidimicrobiia bacterium]|nr:M24 family metallopeptidase [Acidimicrobiia bacterium]
MTIGPLTFDRPLDLGRMRRARHERLVAAMREHEVDVLVLLGQTNVGYATGARSPAADQSRALHRRAVAAVTADGAPPHLWTHTPDRVPTDLGLVVDAGLDLEAEDGATQFVRSLPSGRLAIDDATVPLWAALADREPQDSSGVITTAKIRKTEDELECLRRAQAINEAAIDDVVTELAPGVPPTELTGRFLRRITELGASSNTVDPVWQVMPRSIAEGPYSATGDVVFPTVTTTRPLAAGDLLFVDTGISYEGYQSDYGHTWVVGWDLDAHHREHCRQWLDTLAALLEVTKPGATAHDLTRAAGTVYGRRPWLAHLYLAHGTGTDSAELPFVGTDLGADFDRSVTLAPGMVLVFEPVIWEDGRGGFRAEQIVAVTEDGYEPLSHLSYQAYDVDG